MYLLKLQVQIISGNKEYQDPANRFMQYYHTHLNGEPTNTIQTLLNAYISTANHNQAGVC